MTTITTTPLPTTSNSNNQFSLPPEWINNEMQMMRRVEHLQAAIVELSRNAMQIITWSEMIQDGIDEMQKSITLTIPNLETASEEEKPEFIQDLEQEEEEIKEEKPERAEKEEENNVIQ
jgi:hypothetical protein